MGTATLMPDNLRTVGGVTARWDGQGWVPLSPGTEPAVSDHTPALGRFLGGAASTSMFNPVNLYQTVRHPIDAFSNLLQSHSDEAQKAIENWQQGQYSEAVGHGAAAMLPVLGPMAAHIGERIGTGDIAGGLGEAVGLASNVGMPSAIRGTPRAMSRVGGLAERAGTAVTNSKFGSYGLPIVVSEELLRGNPWGAAATALPYGIKYGGRALRKTGEGLEGLQRAVSSSPSWAERLGSQADEAVARAKMRPVSVGEEAIEPVVAPNPPITNPEYTPVQSLTRLPEPPTEPATLDWLRQAASQAESAEPPTPSFTYEGQAGLNPPGPSVELYNRSSPDVRIPEIVAPGEGTALPASWQPFTENPVTQGLRQVLEELRQRATPGLTNPTGR